MKDGRSLGDRDGFNVGLLVSAREGESDSFTEGEEVGAFVGLVVGFAEGLGLVVGLSVGGLVTGCADGGGLTNNGCAASVVGFKISAFGRFISIAFPVKQADRVIMRKLSESKRSVHQSNFEPRAAYM